MAKVKYLRYALAALATLGVFALTAYTNAGDASTATTAAEPKAGAAAPYAPASAAPYHYQPQRPREDLPCNPPGTWEVYPSPTTNDLYCVDFVDANNGWAAGRSVALRFRNGSWSEITGHSGHVFEGIDMLSTTDGWAVGWDGNKELPAIWRWNGSDWLEFQNPTGGVECIDMIDPLHGWVGGVNYFLRYNGSSWVWGGNAPNIMHGIHMFSETEGRAVGNRYILRRFGSSWVEEYYNYNWVLGSVRMLNPNRGWASGYTRVGEKGLIAEYSGIWREYKVFANSTTIGRLDIYQNDFGWCVGQKTTTPPYGGFIGFFDGVNWYEVNSPSESGLAEVKIINLENAWIVGFNGKILRYKPNVSVRNTSLGKIKAIYR